MTSHCSVRRTITRTTRIHLVALLLTSTALVHATVAAAPEIFQKGDSWIESMSATRAAYRNWVDEQEPKDVDRKQALQQAWQQLRKSYPTQAGWFAADLGPQHLEWFDGSYSSKLDQAAISRAFSGLGGDQAKLPQQLKHLQRMRVPTTDSRWLNLYSRICLLRDARVALDQVWCLDLRRQLAERLQTLVDADATVDDARWDDLRRQTSTIAEQMGSARPIDLAKLHESVALLKKRLPERFPDADRLLIQLEQQQGQWNATIAEAVTAKRLEAMTLAQLSDDINQYRRALVRNLAGMSEYLTVPAQEPLETEWEQDHATLVHDLGNRAYFARVASETYRPESLILETDRDVTDVVLRRAEALLDHLQQSLPAAELHELAEALQQLRAASESVGIENTEARYVLYADICRVRRQIAWKNPLLDFSDILFIKRHRALFNHMCDQYYGMAATPGGGLFVLENAFADDPHVRDVLAKSSVAEGRLKGRQLLGGPPTPPQVSFDGVGNRHGEDDTGGTFLSPDLSYDGSSVLFAYVENDGDRLHRHHIDPAQGHWDAGRCYHVFKVNLDGSDLRQLTDGTWNDFDPCWLPNGRIAFISERRGGYLRCGRVCPNYTLYDMAADGSDMTCLSFHETNEWHPAVSNDGMIIWTRWDYVDRHGCTAHMPWVTTLDGRNPRAVHGNFAPRPKRPDMELDCRPIPGSQHLVATAAPHHGQSYGSLVLIDPKLPDDDAMGPVRRITPEVGFPESQGGGQVYGTAWALSEDFHLCVYDAGMQPGIGRQGRAFMRGDYGIYLVDAFGNRELVYRDPEISCLSPIPVKKRPVPPVAPDVARGGPETNPAARDTHPSTAGVVGTVAIMNVYDSLKPWPDNAKISSVRVLQVFPMSVPSGRPPHDTGLRVASAGDSVVPVRHVLGTAPVEKDGSAFFSVPANVELFFQALDEDGLAVQSMRSATHVRQGERLVCAGCHEPKNTIVTPSEQVPLALLREPSPLVPDVDGSNPFSYPRLVQPVLDRNCVECHKKNSADAPNLGREPLVRNWYASYNSLVYDYAFHNYGDGYRTTPGQFGAYASRLYEILNQGHYGVKLSDEDLHCLTLWLDCTSMFYGVYEKEGGQAQLRGEIARPTLE